LNITSLGRTPADALSAFLRPSADFRHLSPPITLKNAPDDFCPAAWLCTQVHDCDFSRSNPANGSKGSLNPTDNGERGRSLLCGREALAKPSGAAEIS